EDGSSYPNQLTSNELSTLSKIVIVADVISAMFEDRPYRKRLNKQAVISELINGRDTLCDSNSVDVVFQSDLLMPLCRCQMIIR
ncbi:MAG: Putative metal dependent phosphohydrolase, partial [Clostridiales bacterium 38_11]